MPETSVLTIGTFDGVHRGHQALIERAHQIARERGAGGRLPVVAVTFDPHPTAVLRPGTEPPALASIEQRVAALEGRRGGSGADRVEVIETTPDLLAETPEAFVRRMVERYRPAAIVEGGDFRFGRGAKGDVERLRALGAEHGFVVDVVDNVEAVLHDMLVVPVRSSVIRWLLGRGRVADAGRCLGRWYALDARVVVGEKRGHELGYPTVNLDPDALAHRLVPADGVYAGTCALPDGTKRRAAVSIGDKPTFGEGAVAVEAYLLDHEGDLYGAEVELAVQRWLRDQQPFPGPEALRDQMSRDVAHVRRLDGLGLLAGAPSPGPAPRRAA